MINVLIAIQECSSPALAATMQFVKRALLLIQIIGPILLMISLAINLTKLVKNPDDKKLLPKIDKSILATFILFFIPVLVNVVMGWLDNSYMISACWNNASDQKYSAPSYVDPNNGKKKQTFLEDPSDYQKGTPKPTPSPSTSTSGDSGDNVTGDSSQDGGLNTTPGLVSGDVEVHFLNPSSRVDAIYIKAGNESMFIDGGFGSDSKKEMAYLDRLGVKHIDYYMGSHSHKNHVEAAPPIIEKYGIKKVIVGRETCSGSGSTTCTWYAIKKFASNQKRSLDGVTATILKPGDVFYMGGLKFTCIGPMTVKNGMDTGTTAQNYNSLVVRLDYGSTSFLLTGDNASSSTMKQINEKFPGQLKVDVLKNPHHNGCSGESAYSLIGAKYVVFTTRKDYLPSNSCINGMKKTGMTNYYIAADGFSENILFTSDGHNLKVYDHYNVK